MSISIIKPGLLDTLQDLGRFGYANWGVNPGGMMDVYAGTVANMLVGNCCSEAVLEVHFPGPQILFEQNALISITGADFSAMLNDEPLPSWQPVVVRKNTVLHFPKLEWGARCYLAVHGGFQVEKWLGSYSTSVRAAAGGFHGRALQKGDELSSKENSIYFAGWLKEEKIMRVLPWRINSEKVYRLPHEIFAVKGFEWEKLTEGSRYGFEENNFIIHPSSDRMGYRLKGASLEMEEKCELVSSGVSFGTLQLLPGSEMVVLMADHQTAGGYPRIAHVVTAHLPKLAQLRPSDCVQFNLIDIETAEAMYFEQQRELNIIKRSCQDHLNAMVCFR
ncbi:MAG TPA: biotin-dependent carboxyltransferase family protein [Puia sp.]|nr:biotin-dependent carboxyltransferase family protein [Puia sp.]